MEALSRMCQWSNLMFRQCPGSSRCHFSHLEIDSCGGKTDILRRCSPVRPNFFCSYKKIVHAYYRHSKLTRVEDVKAGGPWDSAGRDTSYVAEESRLTHGPCLVSRFRAVWSRWLADFDRGWPRPWLCGRPACEAQIDHHHRKGCMPCVATPTSGTHLILFGITYTWPALIM